MKCGLLVRCNIHVHVHTVYMTVCTLYLSHVGKAFLEFHQFPVVTSINAMHQYYSRPCFLPAGHTNTLTHPTIYILYIYISVYLRLVKFFYNSKLNMIWRWNLHVHQLTSLVESYQILEAHACKPWVTNLSVVLPVLTANTTECIILLKYRTIQWILGYPNLECLKLKSILKCVIWCARQNIAHRGYRDDVKHLSQDFQGNPGNFKALPQFCVESGDLILKEHFETAPANAVYGSKTVQNEVINVTVEWMTRKIAQEVKKAKL